MDRSALHRFFLNESDDAERKKVIAWLLDPGNDALAAEWMRENWDTLSALDINLRDDEPDIEKIWLSVRQRIQEPGKSAAPRLDKDTSRVVPLSFRFKYIAAAVAILLFTAGAYYIGTYHPSSKKTAASELPIPEKNDIAPPAGNKAILTLANGAKVFLDSAGNGTLATQGTMQIIKNDNGEIVYSGSASAEISYNTLSLPRGSKPLRLVLSDGSAVWLNAASSITYPTAFTGEERKVSITGEAYFEVAKNAPRPFYVSGNDISVKVLGTHFNVNTYGNERNVKVTLLEGAVNVSTANKTGILKPGQQAVLRAGHIRVYDNINLDEVMAWKNARFYFTGTDIKTIMREIERYYDVDVEYRDEIPYQFVAKISREVNVSEFLKRLELTNLVHFNITDRKIIVTK